MASLLDPSLPPRYGGAELQMYTLASALCQDLRFEVHFMVDVIPDGKQTPQRMRLHRFPPTIVRGVPVISALVNIGRWVRALRNTGCDWYVQMTGGALTFYAAAARVLLRKRMVFWLSTDADVDGSLLDATPKAKRLYLRGRNWADVVFAQHDGQQTALANQGLRARILPSGFAIPEEGPAVNRDIVLWVASCQRLKQPELFIDLAQALPDLEFVMVMTPRDRAYFDEVVESAQEQSNLEILPGVDDLTPYYRRAIALVNLSTVEGFPNTFIEAAIQRAPVLSLNVDPANMLSEYGAGICAGGDMSLLISSLRLLAEDEGLRKRLGSAGRAYALAHHDVQQTVEVLKREILDGRVSGR